jgi:hypothetical protein
MVSPTGGRGRDRRQGPAGTAAGPARATLSDPEAGAARSTPVAVADEGDGGYGPFAYSLLLFEVSQPSWLRTDCLGKRAADAQQCRTDSPCELAAATRCMHG